MCRLQRLPLTEYNSPGSGACGNSCYVLTSVAPLPRDDCSDSFGLHVLTTFADHGVARLVNVIDICTTKIQCGNYLIKLLEKLI
jgi:hypothetical protein